jgi:hypothetical protein
MFQDIEIGKALLIFFGYCLLDITSTWYFVALSKLWKGTTTILTFCLYMGSGIGIYQYTHAFSYLVFAAAGASLGNFILVSWEIRKQKAAKSKDNL